MGRIVLKAAKKRAARYGETLEQEVPLLVEDMVEEVRENGDVALREFTKRFDGVELDSFQVSDEEVEAATRALPSDLIEILDYVIERITVFAEAQKACLLEFEREVCPGVHLGHRFVPVASCGCYVPGGRYPTMSSPMNSIIPAKVAGVSRVVAVSPPSKGGRIHPAILYGMKASGADEIYALGGAQAIAALAYGTQTIEAVDMIAGPGNQYVVEAKRRVFGVVGIDLLAGPSEVMVIADEHSRPEWVAADILAQCEHDPQARGVLVTNSRRTAEDTLKQIGRQLQRLSTEQVARQSWEDWGEVVIVESLQEAVEFANEWAPEHLEVHTANPHELLPLLQNYGSLFLGERAAEVFADKVSGTNHILPTLRGSRYKGGVWVGTFLKCLTHQWVTEEGMKHLTPHVVRQATAEGMEAHKAAAQIRLY